MSSILTEKLKSNWDDNDVLMLVNEETIEVLENCMNYLKNKKSVYMKYPITQWCWSNLKAMASVYGFRFKYHDVNLCWMDR